MHESPPIYRVHIEEVTSKRTLVTSLFEGPLAPLLREGGEIAAKIEETDAKRFWRDRPYRGRKVAAHG